jgi:hypothetical protein
MLKVILKAPAPIHPFCEPARDLRIQNTPLWLWQRQLLAPYCDREIELAQDSVPPPTSEPTLAYRDNLFFDAPFLAEFVSEARKRNRAVRAAFSAADSAFREHALPLATSYTRVDDLFLADLWYYPNGLVADAEPLIVDLQAREIGYYHVPTYMADKSGDLVFQVPRRALLAIDSWVHVLMADIVFGSLPGVPGSSTASSMTWDLDSGSSLGRCMRVGTSLNVRSSSRSAATARSIRRPSSMVPPSLATM